MSEQDLQHPLYRVIFVQHDKLYELYAKFLSEESLMGFIEIEELIFNEAKSGLAIDPNEEALSAEFKGVRRCYIPLHTILRIDEVMKEGTARVTTPDKLTEKKGNVSHLSFQNPKKPE